MENTEPTNQTEGITPPIQIRNKFLTVLCILTYIGSGLSIIGGIVYALFLDEILLTFEANPSEMSQALYDSLSIMPKGYFAAEALLAAISILGAVFMWKLRKIGFHLYTIANILILGLPIFFGIGQFNFFNLMAITGPFIAMYALNLKQMK
jgi:pilus assembly protein TadC